ncbi:MAG: M20/M25/M40 family metallo-hydrolase [Gemmatimonadales bacterium]|nr:MAG: M20/M25/M40 family metallo-hydrolase [Gemmatimonadales bacterium]
MTPRRFLRPFVALSLLAVPLAAAGTVLPGATPVDDAPRVAGWQSSAPQSDLPEVDAQELLRDLEILAHDSMEGRRPGTPGIERARSFILASLDDRGVAPLHGERFQSFEFQNRRDGQNYVGHNLLGWFQGTEHPDSYIVLTAHYDHLGVVNDQIYNGADDNASGVAVLLAAARHFAANPPAHSVVLAFLDAEEMGLQGARAFVADAPIPLESIVMNINLDMVSRSEVGEIYAAGTYHYPFLLPLVEEVMEASRITVLTGHDSPDLPPGQDWTMASDHAPFHQQGIPFIYFGVEDHAGYHDPSDTFENITPDFFVESARSILHFVTLADRDGQMILERSERETAVSVGQSR